MAAIDYGALLRVDGVFVNKNQDLFMGTFNTGYVCEYATDKNGTEHRIDGNFYVCAGDKDFMLAFCMTHFVAISNNRILREVRLRHVGMEIMIPGYPNVKVVHIDKAYRKSTLFSRFDDDHREHIIRIHGKRKGTKVLRKCAKRLYAAKHGHAKAYNFLSRIYYATWNHNGHKYEVIYGYGVDPNEDVWNDIKYKWDFSDVEREYIDSWFDEK